MPFGRYLLNSTANPAHFHSNWAESAVLFSRYLPNGTHDFFQIFSICFFKDFIKNPQTTIALTFLTHSFSGIGGVCNFRNDFTPFRTNQLIFYYVKVTTSKVNSTSEDF